jgi:hypothetical protein
MRNRFQQAGISEKAKKIHNAFVNLIDELEAVDFYNIKADSLPNSKVKELIINNRNEEIEHAAITLEWIAENFQEFASELQKYHLKSDNFMGKNKNNRNNFDYH